MAALRMRMAIGTCGFCSTKALRKVWREKAADCCHFWTITEWKDITSVKAFAGEDYEKAVYYPEDEGILLEFEERVIHTETFIVK